MSSITGPALLLEIHLISRTAARWSCGAARRVSSALSMMLHADLEMHDLSVDMTRDFRLHAMARYLRTMTAFIAAAVNQLDLAHRTA